MIKSSIKNIVVLPLFIATLLTSFYVMQPQTVDAASKIYKDSGDDDGTPLASDRFDAVEDGKATIHSQSATASGGASTSKVELELQQFIDCETGAVPRGTCQSTSMSGTQSVNLVDQSYRGYVDVEADLFMLQKDDTLGQDRVNNQNTGTQTVNARANSASGSATVDISHNSNDNELNMNMYQYNKRAPIDESTDDFQIDDIEAAVADESNGGGNDDSKNINTATQKYDALALGNSRIQAATSGDQDFTVAQFNAGCDDTDPSYTTSNPPPAIDITCENKALQDVDLDSSGSSQLTFETPSEVEFQQINTCGFSQALNCFNDGKLDVNVLTGGSGVAKVELENPNSKPVLFQENECSDLVRSSGTTANPTQDCNNVSNNFFDVKKTGASNIYQTNLDLQVAQANDCDDATAPIDCINRGLESDVPNLNSRNMQTEFGPNANTIVTVNADGAGSTISKADPDSFLTMVNDCDSANPVSATNLGSNACINQALNEAHFLAISNGDVTVDKAVQESTTTNSCDNLDSNTCQNTAQNILVAQASLGGEILLDSAGTDQTSYSTNNCDSAQCFTNTLNTILLTADQNAEIKTTSTSSGIDQSIDAYNGCTSEASCSITGTNYVNLVADGGSDLTGGNINIEKLDQSIDYTNTCSNAGTTCSFTGTNFYNLVNTSPSTVTVNSDQSLDGTNSFTSGTHNIVESNTFTLQKTTGSSLTVDSSQLINSGATTSNTLNPPGSTSGTFCANQANGQPTTTC